MTITSSTGRISSTAMRDLVVELPLDRLSGGVAAYMRRYRRRLVWADVVATLAASVFAFVVRFGDRSRGGDWLPHLTLTVALPIALISTLALCRVYEVRYLGHGSEEIRRLVDGCVRVTALVAFVSYAAHGDLARGYVVIALPLITALLILIHLLARRSLRRARAAGRCMHRVLVVGDVLGVRDLTTQMMRQRDTGYAVVGACTVERGFDPQLLRDGVPILGNVSDTRELVRLLDIDTVAVASGLSMQGYALRDLAWSLESTDVDLVVGASLTHVAGSRIHIRPVTGLPLLHVERPELSGSHRIVKTLLDRTGAGLALVLLSPVLLAVAVAVRLDSRGPALFRQTRVERNGRLFTMYKFRSMCVDAEARLSSLRDLNENADGLLFKMREDPRITRIGKVLRRFSIDELPQLINVLKGDMSLVGPRPPLPSEVDQYQDDVRRRLLVKPGLTGLWQVSGRSDLDWDESVRLDLHYVENWSLALDVSIIFRTLRAVAGKTGAY